MFAENQAVCILTSKLRPQEWLNGGRNNLKEHNDVCTYIVVSVLTQCGVLCSAASVHSYRTVRTQLPPFWDLSLANCKDDGFLSPIAQNQWHQMRAACLWCGSLEMGRWLERPELVLLYTEQSSCTVFPSIYWQFLWGFCLSDSQPLVVLTPPKSRFSNPLAVCCDTCLPISHTIQSLTLSAQRR